MEGQLVSKTTVIPGMPVLILIGIDRIDYIRPSHVQMYLSKGEVVEKIEV